MFNAIILVFFIMFLVILFFQKRLIDQLNWRINYLAKAYKKTQNLVDLLASATPNLAAKSLYYKLSEIPVEHYPDGHEQISETIEKFSHENYLKQHELLSKAIQDADDPILKAQLQKRLDQYEELKTLTGLLSKDSSDEYKQIVLANINAILREINEVPEDET